MTKERKIILIIGLALLTLGAIYRFIPETSGKWVSDDAYLMRVKQYEQQQRLIIHKGEIHRRLSGAEKNIQQLNQQLLKGETPALAAVNLQNVIKEAALKSGLQTQRVQVMNSQDRNNTSSYAPVGVKFKVSGTSRQIMDIVYSLESGRKKLQITEIQIHTLKKYPKIDEPLIISADVVVQGFMSLK